MRAIVDGTWGFASHAELNPDVAASTARRAVQVARTLAPLNADESRQIVRDHLAEDQVLPGALIEELVRRAEGLMGFFDC